MDLEAREDGDEIQDYLVELTGDRCVPKVFIGGSLIGGNHPSPGRPPTLCAATNARAVA